MSNYMRCGSDEMHVGYRVAVLSVRLGGFSWSVGEYVAGRR